jgi:hypothetical protein
MVLFQTFFRTDANAVSMMIDFLAMHTEHTTGCLQTHSDRKRLFALIPHRTRRTVAPAANQQLEHAEMLYTVSRSNNPPQL